MKVRGFLEFLGLMIVIFFLSSLAIGGLVLFDRAQLPSFNLGGGISNASEENSSEKTTLNSNTISTFLGNLTANTAKAQEQTKTVMLKDGLSSEGKRILSFNLLAESDVILSNVCLSLSTASADDSISGTLMFHTPQGKCPILISKGETLLLSGPLPLKADEPNSFWLEEDEIKGRGTLIAKIIEIKATRTDGGPVGAQNLPIEGRMEIAGPITFAAKNLVEFEEVKKKAQPGDKIELKLEDGKIVIPVN